MTTKYPALAATKPKSANSYAESLPIAARSPGAHMALGNLVVGFFALMMMSFFIAALGFGGVILMRDGSVAQFFGGIALLLWAMLVEVPTVFVLLFCTAQCGSIDGPVMLRLAERQRCWPQGLRQLVGLWWLTHAVPTVTLLASMVSAPPETLFVTRVEMGVGVVLIASLSFGFLAMAWACFDKSDARLRGLWNLRWWWVAAIAFACLLAAVARRFGLL